MTTYYISVNRAVLRHNKKMKRNDPPYEIRTAKTDTDPTKVSTVQFSGQIRFVYDPAAPLISGAVCWAEVDA